MKLFTLLAKHSRRFEDTQHVISRSKQLSYHTSKVVSYNVEVLRSVPVKLKLLTLVDQLS
jgi:hypothetical protein